MTRHCVAVEGLGHGSQPIPLCVAIGPLLVTGSISGVDPATGERPESLRDEIENAFSNMSQILEAGGFTMGDAAKIEVTLDAQSSRDSLNDVWIKWFPDAADRPVRHATFAGLPRNFRIQLSVLAFRA